MGAELSKWGDMLKPVLLPSEEQEQELPSELERNRILSGTWFMEDRFGFGTLPATKDSQLPIDFAETLFAAAAADGLAPEEADWIKGYCAVRGYSVKQMARVEEVSKMDQDQLLALKVKHLERLTPKPGEEFKVGGALQARFMLYSMIHASYADDEYADDEKKAVYAFAAAISVDESDVDAIVKIVQEERELKERRIRALFPKGHPFHTKRWKAKLGFADP